METPIKDTITYNDYIATKDKDEPIKFDYGGMVADVYGIYNIYKTLNSDGSCCFEFDKVLEVVPTYVGIDIPIILGLTMYNFKEAETELSQSAIVDLKKSLDKWNKKYGSVQYVCTGLHIDLRDKFKELDEKLAALTDDEGGKIKVFCAEHHYLEKAKEILQNAGKYNPDDKD